MSNLGGYQILTTLAKKVGGPGKLVALIASGGAVVGGIAVKGGEAVLAKYRKAAFRRASKKQEKKERPIYTVTKDGESNQGLKLQKGKTFRVLESDGDAVLIELIGDGNNPYFVSKKLLQEISDYKG